MKTYFAAFLPEAEGGYSVFFPDVCGLQTQGETLDEAFEMAVDALAGHLEVLANDGDHIPEPRTLEQVKAFFKTCCEELCIDHSAAFFQMVPAPDLDTQNVRVTVSFRRYALDMIDRKAEAAGMTRSGFLMYAASQFEAESRG